MLTKQEARAQTVKDEPEVINSPGRQQEILQQQLESLVAWEQQHAHSKKHEDTNLASRAALPRHTAGNHRKSNSRIDPSRSLEPVLMVPPIEVNRVFTTEQPSLELATDTSDSTPEQSEAVGFELAEISADTSDTLSIGERSQPGLDVAEDMDEDPVVEAGIEDVISQIEAELHEAEAEFIGELLLGLFVDAQFEGDYSDSADETEHESLDEPGQEETGFVLGDIDAISIEQTRDGEDVASELTILLESLDEPEAEAVQSLVSEFTAIVESIKKQDAVEGELPKPIENIELIEQRLETIVVELFDRLGLDYNEQAIKTFIRNILEVSYQEADKTSPSIDYLNKMGTREYRATDVNISLIGMLSQYMRQKLQALALVGRYSLRVSDCLELSYGQ